MKKIYVSLLLLLTCATVFAQSFSLQLVGSAGGQTNNGAFQTSWSIGEPVTATASAGPYTLTQGFQQNGSPTIVASVLANVSCYGGSNGSVTVTASGGISPYTYAWSSSPVQHTQTATGLPAGTYWVTVTDANANTATASATVNQPATPLSATASMLNPVTCYGGSDGSTNVTGGGGTGSYSYSWSSSPVQHTQSATGLPMGTYWVTVTDANSCTATASAAVTQPPQWWPGLTGPSAPICVNSTGNVYTTDAGKNNYVWTVSAGGTITAGGGSSNNTVTVTWNVLGPQTVTVNYTDPANHNCTAYAPAVMNVTVTGPNPVISGATTVSQGQVVTYSTPYVANHSYSWSVSNGDAMICLPNKNCITVTWLFPCGIINPGYVTVTETDLATGCVVTVTKWITITP